MNEEKAAHEFNKAEHIHLNLVNELRQLSQKMLNSEAMQRLIE